MQGDVRVLLYKTTDNRGQCITGLGMRGGDAEITLSLVTEFLGNLLDALNPPQDFAGLANNDLAARCDSGEMLAAAGKYFKPQLVLQQADLFGDTRLGREQTLGGC